jgi:hypothetical protein
LVNKRKYIILAIWALLVVLYLRYKAPIIWRADWSHDDLMNCYRAMQTPWRTMLIDTLMFWKPSELFRPLGEIFYKLFWEQFGFSPLPWRLAISVLLLANAFILGHLANRLSGSMAVGLAATAIASFHSLWTHLYLNTGTIFEILAYTFVYGALAYYVEFRDPYFTTILLILGLNSKESAIILPVLVVLYEWIWNKRTPWLFCGLAGTVCVAFIFGRIYGPGGLTSIGSYQPVYSIATYMERFRGYFGPLILWKQIPYWALPLAAAPLLLRNKQAVFSVLLFPLAILPLAFVPDRGLEGVYIACAALPLGLSSALLLIPKEDWRLPGAALLFLTTAFWMPGTYLIDGWDREQNEIRAFHQSLKQLAPTLPQGAQLRFINEPFAEDVPWASTFATRLLYKDPSLLIISPNSPANKDLPAEKDTVVFDWRDNKLYRIK